MHVFPLLLMLYLKKIFFFFTTELKFILFHNTIPRHLYSSIGTRG